MLSETLKAENSPSHQAPCAASFVARLGKAGRALGPRPLQMQGGRKQWALGPRAHSALQGNHAHASRKAVSPPTPNALYPSHLLFYGGILDETSYLSVLSQQF